MLTSRLLCYDLSTGNRRELYRCYACSNGACYTSLPALHDHLTSQHVTQFTCKVCEHLSLSPSQFSLHVHQTHIVPAMGAAHTHVTAPDEKTSSPASPSHVKNNNDSSVSDEEVNRLASYFCITSYVVCMCFTIRLHLTVIA